MTKEELEKLYNESYRAVYWTAISLLKNHEEAEDVVQDTFITAYNSYDSLNDKSKALPWIKKIAANKCLNILSRRRTFLSDDEFFENTEVSDEEFIPGALIESDAERKVMMDIIDRNLSEDSRMTVILYYFDEMSVKEIVDRLSIPKGTVLSRLSYARKIIKKEVERYEEDNDDRLFAVGAVSLAGLFGKEAEQVPHRNMPSSLIKLTASGKTAAGLKAAADGGKAIMLKKVIIAAAAVTVLGGGTVVVVDKMADNSSDTVEENIEETTTEEPVEESTTAETEETTVETTEASAEETTEETVEETTEETTAAPVIEVYTGDEYQDFIDGYTEAARNGEQVYSAGNGTVISPQNPSGSFSYTFTDVDNDGQHELMIGSLDYNEAGEAVVHVKGFVVIDQYGEYQILASSWDRSWYSYTGAGHFISEYSSNAGANRYRSLYHYDAGSCSMVEDMYAESEFLPDGSFSGTEEFNAINEEAASGGNELVDAEWIEVNI